MKSKCEREQLDPEEARQKQGGTAENAAKAALWAKRPSQASGWHQFRVGRLAEYKCKSRLKKKKLFKVSDFRLRQSGKFYH